MNMILFKPNSFIEGMFGSSKARDLSIFNNILCNLQSQKANGNFIATVPLKQLQSIISDKNITTPIKIQAYLNNNFREKTITWKHDCKIYSVGLINDIVYDEITKNFDITINQHLVDFALNYKEKKLGYTPLNLNLNTKDFAAKVLYENLRRWSGIKNERIISLDELKRMFLLEGRYAVYANFRRRVIDPAKKEIKSKFNMIVTSDEITDGNKVIAIKFMFEDNEPRKYSFVQEELKVDVESIKEGGVDPRQKLFEQCNMKPLALNTLDKLEKDYGKELLEKAIIIMGENNKKKKVGAPAKYLTSILNNLKENNSTINVKSFNNFAPGTPVESLKEIGEQIQYGTKNDVKTEDNSDIPNCLKKYLGNNEES